VDAPGCKAVLAHKSQAASLVHATHAVHSRFKHLELISIRDTLCLMILVLQDEQHPPGDAPIARVCGNRPRLAKSSNKLNAGWQLYCAEIENSRNPELAQMRAWELEVCSLFISSMKQADRRALSEVYKDGLDQCASSPEFVEADKRYRSSKSWKNRACWSRSLARILNATASNPIGGEGSRPDRGCEYVCRPMVSKDPLAVSRWWARCVCPMIGAISVVRYVGPPAG